MDIDFLKIGRTLVVLLMLIAAISGMYEFSKFVMQGLYYFSYEDMVIETIKEKVKKDSLID